MCYTRKASMSEDRRMADDRAGEMHMHAKRARVIDSLLGSDKDDRKATPEHTPAKETMPAK